jgi:vacuolar protein sorting-associated protein 35
MQIFNDLKDLEDYLLDEKKKGRHMADVYESVQQATELLPRLYLLITAGSVFIESQETSAKEILKDLVEMAKGIQHPMRGLFLRYFLLKKLKDRLPDKKSKFEG